ncbi:hypothetical protein HJG60_012120 [Phyllostomus discolor]|uniref:Transmembrane protein n=1 Tax=Phyllostomus discolor TaxID=89673 RepID=A0A833ZLM1_9CHIR|nr:hypothetical protein HJG60_012120 [Phyllostomus discolor]
MESTVPLKEKQTQQTNFPPSLPSFSPFFLPIRLSVICLSIFNLPFPVIKVKHCNRPNVEIAEQCSLFSTFPRMETFVGCTSSLPGAPTTMKSIQDQNKNIIITIFMYDLFLIYHLYVLNTLKGGHEICMFLKRECDG